MQSSYRVKPLHNVLNQTINRALTHFSNRFPMTRLPDRPQFTSTNPGAAVSPNVAIEDWDVLFTAVKARLWLIGQPQDAPGPESPPADALQLVRASVLECVQALDQLHTTAQDELAKRGR